MLSLTQRGGPAWSCSSAARPASSASASAASIPLLLQRRRRCSAAAHVAARARPLSAIAAAQWPQRPSLRLRLAGRCHASAAGSGGSADAGAGSDNAAAAAASGHDHQQAGPGGGSAAGGGDAVALPAASPAASETFVTSAGVIEDVEERDARFDYLGETTEGNLHFARRLRRAGGGVADLLFGLRSADGVVKADLGQLRGAVQDVLAALDAAPPDGAAGPSRPDRAVYTSRTLNLRAIKAIGYDLDYTLVHYDVEAWEGRAYAYGLEALRQQGAPVDGLVFDSSLVIRGLIVDKELGNLIKVDRFGLVKRAMHGTRMLSWQEIRAQYGREVVNLRNEGRWVFLNTLFSVSEAVLFAQLVDRLDAGEFAATLPPLAPGGAQLTYQGLYRMVAKALFRAHVEGKLKAEIIQDPERFVELDPGMAATLLDQRDAGKALVLITNSDYAYADALMSCCYDRFLPDGMTWRDLFDMVVVMARKPQFFEHSMSLFEIVTPDGLMRPALTARRGGLYCGGSARMVEKALGVEGDDVLYVGDHLYTDNALAKINFRWRTALVLRELEEEIDALARGRPHRARLRALMARKDLVGALFDHLRLARQRALAGRGGGGGSGSGGGAGSGSGSGGSGGGAGGDASGGGSASAAGALGDGVAALNEALAQLLVALDALDAEIGPMLEADGRHFSERWGYLSRAGLNDKSQICRQIEKCADVYTSRVSNFLAYTPYAYFRAPSQSLAHDRGLTSYYESVLLPGGGGGEEEGLEEGGLAGGGGGGYERGGGGGGGIRGSIGLEGLEFEGSGSAGGGGGGSRSFEDDDVGGGIGGSGGSGGALGNAAAQAAPPRGAKGGRLSAGDGGGGGGASGGKRGAGGSAR